MIFVPKFSGIDGFDSVKSTCALTTNRPVINVLSTEGIILDHLQFGCNPQASLMVNVPRSGNAVQFCQNITTTTTISGSGKRAYRLLAFAVIDLQG